MSNPISPTTMASPDFGPILNPEVAFNVLVNPLAAESVAGQVSTVHNTLKNTVNFPRVLKDPNTTWLSEGEEINASAPELGEVIVIPSKVAGLSVVSNELLADSDVPVSEIVGSGLVRDIANRVDAALFGDLPAPAPAGLESLDSVTEVSAGTEWTNLDAFQEAVNAAATVNANLDVFVAHPDDLLDLSRLKRATGSNESLLAPSPTDAATYTAAGRPLLPCSHVTPGTVWGIPRDRVMMVVRNDATLDVSDGPFFTSDRVAIRATMRVGFGFIEPEAIVKISKGA